MGVGKGQTARALSALTGMYAVDCDDLIESHANMKIRKIFAGEGENYFRGLEKKTALWLEDHVSGTIISTGGGFVNVANLKRIGVVVYLHSDIDGILEGITGHPNASKKIKKRPLLADLDKARELYHQRLPLYRDRADVEIDVRGKTPEQVAAEITRAVGL